VFEAWLTAWSHLPEAVARAKRRPLRLRAIASSNTTTPPHSHHARSASYRSVSFATSHNGASQHASVRDATITPLDNGRLSLSRPLCCTTKPKQCAKLVLFGHEPRDFDELLRQGKRRTSHARKYATADQGEGLARRVCPDANAGFGLGGSREWQQATADRRI
jgi:hypothetical protein